MTVRYTSADEDSARWRAVGLRGGDVIVSTRSKHGTTWVQAILLMLVHGTELPGSLTALSPWVDHVVEPIDDVVRRLDAQPHRRVMKSHTPLDGLPADPHVHRVVVARHPLDAAVSLYHQGDNLDRARIAELTGTPVTDVADRPGPGEWLRRWVREEADPRQRMDSLDGVLHHILDAWRRRDDQGVVLVHFADLRDDLDGEVRRLARAVGLGHDPAIARAATFDSMRRRADRLAPDTLGVLRDRNRFFRSGRSGEGLASVTDEDLAHYRRRVGAVLPGDLDEWLHR